MNLGAGFKQRALMKRDKLPNPEVWESEHITGKGKKHFSMLTIGLVFIHKHFRQIIMAI